MSSAPDLATLVKRAKPRPLRKWLIIIGIVLAIAAVVIFMQARSSERNRLPTYVTEPLHRGDLSVTIDATGNLEPTNQVTVGSELSGTVLEVYVEANDRVTRGQKLALLDTSRLSQQTERSRAALISAEARVAQAEATLRETEARLKRLQELHRISEGRTPSQSELETAIAVAERSAADLRSVEAAVSEAEAEVLANESDLAKALLRSPVDGMVLTRTIEPGQTVAAQFTAPELFIIAENLETMKLQVAVAEADIGKVKEGQQATFTVDAWPDRAYHADVKVVSFGSTITDNVVTYETELTVPNDDLSLRPGMTATAAIEIGSREDVLLVPAAALRFRPPVEAEGEVSEDDRPFLQRLAPRRPRGVPRPTDEDELETSEPGEGKVWVLQQGQAVAVPVRTDLSDGRHTEVISEKLEVGDPVITRLSTAPAS